MCTRQYRYFTLGMCRDAVSLSKSPDSELNRQRSELLVAGSQLELGSDESRIPILILPHMAGYDLCIPAGFLIFHLTSITECTGI
jgi:hypothetical protein